jgi:hypothetical protein
VFVALGRGFVVDLGCGTHMLLMYYAAFKVV